MTEQQHILAQPQPGPIDTNVVAGAAVHMGHALVLTDPYGVITRVTCAVPWGVFSYGNAVPGRHVSVLLGEQDRHFVRDVLQRMRNSTTFTVKGAQVRMDSVAEDRAYMDVIRINGPTPASGVFAWRFSMRSRALFDASIESERGLARRVRILEQRLAVQQQTAERRSAALNALTSSVQALAKSLRVSRAYSQQQAEQIATLTAERDQLARRIRTERAAANRARQAERGVRSRLDFLTEVRWVLSELVDVNSTLRRIAEMIVPDFADCCVVDLLDAERSVLTHAVVACRDPDVRSRIEALPESGFIDAGVSHPLRHALLSGYPSVSHNLDQLTLDQQPHPAGFLDNAAEVGITACIVTPLRARDRILGTLTLASTEPGYRYLPEHLQFAEDMALPVAQALDNALLSQDAEQSSTTQREHLSMVSHELRSPMSIISGFAYLLQRQAARTEIDREQITKLSAELQDGVIRLAETASNLLLPDEDEDDARHPSHQIVDLVAMVAAIVERIDSPAGADQAGRMRVNAPASIHGVLNGHAIGRAVEHILSHALQHSTLDSTVMVTLEQVGSIAVLAVQIIGSDSEDIEHEHPLSPAMQARSGTLSGFGTGPAVNMAEMVIAKYGGRLALEDSLERGKRLTLTLPISSSGTPA